jgi:hypothetical protein
MWKEIRMLHEGKSALVKADVRKRMLLAHCDEGRDVKAHFGELNRLRQIMVGMGTIVLCSNSHGVTPRLILTYNFHLRSCHRIFIQGSNCPGANHCSKRRV